MQKREFKYEFPFFKYYFDTAPFYFQFVEKPPVKKAEGFCLLVVDKV